MNTNNLLTYLFQTKDIKQLNPRDLNLLRKQHGISINDRRPTRYQRWAVCWEYIQKTPVNSAMCSPWQKLKVLILTDDETVLHVEVGAFFPAG